MKKLTATVLIIVILIVGAVAYYLILQKTLAPGEIPAYVTGEMREVYGWAKTAEGKVLLEQVPCYCGCSYEGHKHARHCFWRDDGVFDNHAISCSTCFNTGKKVMEMHEEGKNICEIRKEIDDFYKDVKNLVTETPMPESCII